MAYTVRSGVAPHRAIVVDVWSDLVSPWCYLAKARLRSAIDAWERPPVFQWLEERGVEEDEARRVFNLGIGMCAVVPEAPQGSIVIGRLE